MAINGSPINAVPVNAPDQITWVQKLVVAINSILPIAYGPGVINQDQLNLFPINGALWVYTNGLSVSLQVLRAKILTYTSTSLSTIALLKLKAILLSVLSTSSVTIVKAISKTLSILSTSVSTISKLVAHLLSF